MGLTRCPYSGGTARSNILMFGGNKSSDFIRAHRQERLVVIEIGAGTAIPTIRRFGEGLGESYNAAVLRINPHESFIHEPHISLSCGALEGLRRIDEFL